MKIAITASEPQLDAPVDPRFGRCPFFVIVETDDLSFEAVPNTSQALGQGTGIQSARTTAQRGAKYVLTGNCGPNAHQALSAAGVGAIVGCTGAVRQAVEQFKAGQSRLATAPNARAHGQMAEPGVDPSASQRPATGFPPDPSAPGTTPSGGRGMGWGRGGGMGRGRGMGMGRRRAGGRGRGGDA